MTRRGSHCAGNELVGRVRRFESSKEMLEMELAARCKAVIRSVVIIEEKKDWIWTSFGGFYTIGNYWGFILLYTCVDLSMEMMYSNVVANR